MASGLGAWLSSFRRLHARARAGTLEGADRARYLAGRDELARALLAAQKLQLRPGELPRRALRVPVALQVEIAFGGSKVQAVSLELSILGFSCLLGTAPRVADRVHFTMRIPGAAALSGSASVRGVKALQGTTRVGFEFLTLAEENRELLELLVFDAILAQIAGPPPDPE